MKRLFSFTLLIAFAALTHAQAPAYCSQNGVAIKGYDVVAYFKDSAAVAGNKQFSYTWQNTEWYFKNQANLDAFKAAPEKYAPQFGGYCAYGVSQDHKSPTDPVAFTILNNKLYLNYNPKVKTLWMKDTNGNIEKAEANWPALKDKN